MADLRDFLQSMSNSAASNVSAPVDGINWLLGKAGLPVSSVPFMGSDWMAQKGLTRPVQQGAASILGETAGMVAPMAIAAKAPQIARGLLQAGENAMIPRTLNPQTGAIVWHGSPHKFDKFDSGKIGTGEGAQAYGHGLYLAESPDVAKSYQTTLTMDRGFNFGGKSGLTREQLQDLVNAREGGKYLDGVTKPSGVADQVIDSIVYGKNGELPRSYKAGSERAALFEKLKQEIAHTDQGALYKVDLPDEHIAKMLDWDKPLSQQPPEVQTIFGNSNKMTGAQALKAIEANPEQYFSQIMSGKDLTGAMIRPERGSSEFLRQKGIPGIRYLDGGSRGTGAGTSNFVVFPGNEDILKIMERNGKGLLAD